MAREIKIGHDRRPAPIIPTNVPLYNLQTGQPLVDEGGTPLVSAEDTVLSSEATADKATPVVFTNEPSFNKTKNIKLTGRNFSVTGDIVIAEAGTGAFISEISSGDKLLLPTGLEGSTKVYEIRIVFEVTGEDSCKLTQPVTSNSILFGELIKLTSLKVDPTFPVEEQFAAFSEVSTTILGYPKAEEQLGLFSNVSSYGLDEDEFLFYRNDSLIYQPESWATRKNRIYGDHYRSRYREAKEESAIILETFRTPYSYPYGPDFANGFSAESYQRFNNFLKIGALLYDTYKDVDFGYSQNFLPYIPNHVTIDNIFTGSNAVYQTINSQQYLINNFVTGEQIRRTDTQEIIGTVRQYRMEDKVLHFNEEIGLLLSEENLQEIPIEGVTSNTTATIVSDMTFEKSDAFFSNMLTPLNPAFADSTAFFAQVDTWTETWRDINKGIFDKPNGAPLDADEVNANPLIQKFIVQALDLTGDDINVYQNSRPGYGTNLVSRAYLESRKAFRYQPGRISGYTFGVRASNDARDDNNVIIEWGIGNDTDDLVFQIRGSNFSIVRRSVVPLSDDVLAKNQLFPEDQVLITKDTQNNTVFTGLEDREVYETVITRDRWNGDPLNGNGPSGYNWVAENVTMYKIEFGWYGAIGVQFYAYVPIGGGDARWVKLHRLVIENQLGQPCMGDPYYKFKYSLIVNDYVNVRTPQYIYKYGTSCYIDGGDEGTVKVASATSNPKIAPVESVEGAQRSTTLVAIQPKAVINNSLGKNIKNKQSIFPKELSVSCSGLSEITIVKCKSCPGFGYTYQPNLEAGYNGTERFFAFPPLTGGFDRTKVELKRLTKSASGTSGSFTITLNDSQFLRAGDIIDPNQTNPAIPANTIIEEIAGNIIILNNQLTANVSGDIEIQPVFLQKDYFSKIIANRIWNTYIGDFDDSTLKSISGLEPRYTRVELQTVDSNAVGGLQDLVASEYLAEREIPENYRLGFDTIVSYPVEFPGRLSQYSALAASGIPVIGRKNSLLFMVPNYRTIDTGSYSSGQYADWRIGVTSLKPSSDGVGGITWSDSQGNPVEFTEDYKLYAERFAEGIDQDEDGYERGETDFGRVPAFTVDYRIPQPEGSNTGRCQFVNITVGDAEFISCKQVRGNQLPVADIQSSYPSFNVNKWYIRSSSFPFTFNPQNAEIGFNPLDPTGSDEAPNVGAGVYFNSDVITYSTIEEGNLVTYQLIELSDKLYQDATEQLTDVTIWYIPISLETFRKLATKALNFNPYPLYFFVECRDGARINGPLIKEVGQITNTYNPRWIVSNSMTIDTSGIEVGPIGDTKVTTGNLTDAPPNFTDTDRLSSALIDVQNESQLRPYEVIDKLYVGQDTKTISLDNIFDFEKETITPDLLNTTAYFFIATSKEPVSTEVQATLTYIEQQ
jgi:hypothetical protein